MNEQQQQGPTEVTQAPPPPQAPNADMAKQLEAAREETARLARVEACQHVGSKITGR